MSYIHVHHNLYIENYPGYCILAYRSVEKKLTTRLDISSKLSIISFRKLNVWIRLRIVFHNRNPN